MKLSERFDKVFDGDVSLVREFRRLFVTIICIPILFLLDYLSTTVRYADQGFFCDDDEIRYPYKPDTVSSETMHLIYSTIIVILVLICELSMHRKASPKRLLDNDKKQRILLLFARTVFLIGIYKCGILANSFALGLFKRTSGRLRPNFIAICKPENLEELCPLGSNAFVENIKCTGESTPNLHFSFPSGHSADSLFFATFAIYYLQRRFRFPTVIKAFIQFFVFVLAVFICLSRVSDYKHRYVDVAGGAILGISISLGLIHFVLYDFRVLKNRHPDSQESTSLLRPNYRANSMEV